ncbi:hypothetical protein [Streptomyces sp. WMMC905]|uniref:hypothetical protein n=1 Tax=Streptomyces sp. WMMC905 TaxID=3404123 RepID=UPI003B9606EA
MTGSTPSRKRRLPWRAADPGPLGGPRRARDDERGPTDPGTASFETVVASTDRGTSPPSPSPSVSRRGPAALGDATRAGLRRGGFAAKAALSRLADRIIDIAPRIPVRDLATLRRQFPGLGPEDIADRLVAGAARSTATVGAGVGAAAMLPVPPAMPAELAAEITGVAAVELKLIAELHEVYGLRPPGNLARRSSAYLESWTEERGVDVTRPSTYSAAVDGPMRHRLRGQVMKRVARNLPNLLPFMIGAAAGAVMNRRDTRKLATRIRRDLRDRQVPWDTLTGLPALETPPDALDMGPAGGSFRRRARD